MMADVFSAFDCGDMAVLYPFDESSRRVGLWLLPRSRVVDMVERRSRLSGIEIHGDLDQAPRAWTVESLVQVACLGDDAATSYAQGLTMRNAASTLQLQLIGQEVQREGSSLCIVTLLGHPSGWTCKHELRYTEGDGALRLRVILDNASAAPLVVEMLSSFSLSGITPFAADDAPGRLVAHRLRSYWSAEARPAHDTIEDLHLVPSWASQGAHVERFGQVGTMPVRGFAPLAAVEDRQAGVLWGAQLAWAGSWQMELYRTHDTLSLSGGLADYEYGHWRKRLLPGQSFTTPEAWVTVHDGGFDELCQRLTSMGERATANLPPVEAALPIQFNEYCTSWGRPRHDDILALADRLRGLPVRYFVIDAGWYAREGVTWFSSHGDWVASPTLFPQGLEATTAALRTRGFIPGLWFEIENCGPDATAFSLTEHLLARDGHPICAGSRRFWDMCDPWVVEYLTSHVIELLDRCGFGYLKIDYNETIGIGCDGAESLGEGLRRQVEGVYAFFDRLRARLPDLVIENCSSGGHRLEPSLMGRSSMGSFSDAHEPREIPIIAANLHRLILPRQSLVWSALRESDDRRRLIYSLASTFLGRVCLSGDILALRDEQWQVVEQALRLYEQAAPVIRAGTSRWFGSPVANERHPSGWQGIVRLGASGGQALAVLHAFAQPYPETVICDLPAGRWQVIGSLTSEAVVAGEDGRSLAWTPGGAFSGCVALLEAH